MNEVKFIEGYKAFDNDFTAMNNVKFSVGMHRHVDGEISSGPSKGWGFHLCKNFEDTFRFVGDNPILCEVIGFGTIGSEHIDEYNDYDGIYACSDIFIKRIIPREEIIEMATKLYDYKLQRLITTYKMTDEEIETIEKSLTKQDQKTKKFIDYYHRGNKDAFK